MNRLTWDFNHTAGIMLPPGSYRVRLTTGAFADTKALRLVIDPRVAANGVTTIDLREQYERSTRTRELVNEMNRVANRIRQERTRLRTAGSTDALAKINDLATTAFGVGEGIRYGQPGLLTHISYLSGLATRTDQKVGRDAIERYQALRKELDALEARVNALLGPEKSGSYVP